MQPLHLVTFQNKKNGSLGVGILEKDKNRIVDLAQTLQINDMKSFLKAAYAPESSIMPKMEEIVRSSNHTIKLSDADLKAPINNPDKIICVGLNYMDHAIEAKMAIPSEPVLFSKFVNSIIGPNESIIKPKVTNELDYEVELVIVIGRQGHNIPEDKAMEYIAGFTVGHDVSARDWQLRKPGGQWLAGKTFDTFAPIGPSIVTKVSDPHNLGIRCILNDKVVQQSNTNQLIFKTEKLISYISQVVTLQPGDLIFTGTPPGVGFARKPPLFMQPGDKVTCEIDEIGSLTNYVKEEQASKL